MRTKLLLMGLLLAITVVNDRIVYHDAAVFPLLGKATESTLTRYERLPNSLQNISRKPLWELGKNSAGLAVRFRSNSTCIAAKWEVLNNFSMNHMTPTGIKGLDLYCLQNGKWIFAGSGHPQGKVNTATIVNNMLPQEREYLLYLSLYDGVTSLAIGVDASLFVLDFLPNATVEQMNERADKFYSIIRKKHPDTPILFIEDPIFTHSPFDTRIAKEVKDKNETINAIFQLLQKRGEKNIYFLSSKDIIGHDGEATVDGVHFTDLGFMRYAEVLYPMITKLLAK